MISINCTVRGWLTRVRKHQIMLPSFQGFEAWGPDLVTDLLTNIIRGLPIGSALVLDVGHKLPFISREIVTAPKKGDWTDELLLDGQQRITAIWRSLNDTYPDKTYLLYLPAYLLYLPDENEEEIEPYVYYQTRWKKGGKKYPLWVDLPSECWERKSIPLKLLNPDNEKEYKKWARKASGGDKNIKLEITDVLSSFRSSVANFVIPCVSLKSTTPRDVAIGVFEKFNTKYICSTAFDIVVAQVEAATGQSLHDLVGSLKGSVPEIIYYTESSDLILTIAALLQDKYPSQRSYLNLDFEKIVDDWPKIVNGTKKLVSFLAEERVLDSYRLPIEPILAPIGALWSEVDGSPDEIGKIRILLRKYLWRAFFSTRYDRAVHSAVLQDYRALKKVILGKIEQNEIPCFNEKAYPLPAHEALIEAQWPKYKDRLAMAILLLSLRGDAEDIADGAVASITSVQQREYHHLYPVAWLRDNEIDEENAYRALNCILVSWKTNRTISAKEPIRYLLESCEASTLGESEIRRRLKSHFVDFDLLRQGDYRKFIEGRADGCFHAIKALCAGIAWRPE